MVGGPDMAFPRLNNISFWCASLWILIGHISFNLSLTSSLVMGLIHPVWYGWDLNVSSLLIYCKSCSLPQGENLEGPEHATNAVTELYAYKETLDKFLMVSPTVWWGQLNPLEQVHILILMRPDQSPVKRSVNNLNQQDGNSTPKRNIIYQESTTRLPNGSNSYGDGGLILSISPRMQTNTKVTQFTRSFMVGAGNGTTNEMKLESVDNKYINLYKLICTESLIIKAYKNVKSNSGSMTPGIDGLNPDGFSKKYVDDLVNELKTEKFRFTPVKRIYIPKANGKTRPLGIPTARDRTVQEAIRILLEIIFEGKFSNLSHRPKRSCHSALQQISKWNGITWMIEGEIKGFFENVNYKILANVLISHIKDQQFMDLYWKLVRAGYMDNGVRTGGGKGGIVSPILSNIYLNEFDRFVSELIEKLSSKDKLISKVNPKIVKYSDKLSQLDNKYYATKEKNIIKQIKELRRERNLMPSRIRTKNRIWYVRYADDWLIGIIGDKSLALHIKELCKKFLKEELDVELSEEKTKITNVTKYNVRFLGVDIKSGDESKIVTRVVKGRKIKSRINYTRLYFYLPVETTLNKLKEQGYIKTYTSSEGVSKLVPNAMTKWIFLDHRSIILRYNAVIRGLVNYYGFVDNAYSFHSIINLFLHHSCAKTLARKLNLGNRAKAFKKFGRYLSSPKIDNLKPTELFTKSSYKKDIEVLQKNIPMKMDPFAVTNWSLETQIGFFEPCWICGKENETEMHHVKHLRKEGLKPTGFVALMSKLNRKQIPVCKSCHLRIHKGIYNDLSLKDLHKKTRKKIN